MTITAEDPDDLPEQGHVSISFEIFDYKGVRTNVIKESLLTSEFLRQASYELYPILQRMKDATSKEILSPSVRTEML